MGHLSHPVLHSEFESYLARSYVKVKQMIRPYCTHNSFFRVAGIPYNHNYCFVYFNLNLLYGLLKFYKQSKGRVRIQSFVTTLSFL